jgi:hypothetical protein
VDNNYLNLGMSKSGFFHCLPSGRLNFRIIWLCLVQVILIQDFQVNLE